MPPDFLARHRDLFDFSRVDTAGLVTITLGAGRATPLVRGPLAPPPPDRPRDFENFIGLARVKAMFQPSIGDARRCGVPLDPVLLSGAPGLGKTAVAHAIAGKLGPASWART